MDQTPSNISVMVTTSSMVVKSNKYNWPQKRVHFLTWSRANLDLLPIVPDPQDPMAREDPRRTFANLVAGYWEEQKSKLTKQMIPDQLLVEQWVCCMEKHRGKEEGEHSDAQFQHHFHFVVKLRRPMRAGAVWKKLHNTNNISVNFSERAKCTYWQGFKYCTKEDAGFQVSAGHPVLPGVASSFADSDPSTEDGQNGAQCDAQDDAPNDVQKNAEKKEGIGPAKQRRLDAVDIIRIIVDNGIHTDTELCAFAKRSEMDGRPDVLRWVANHPQASKRMETIETAWALETAQDRLNEQQQLQVETAQLNFIKKIKQHFYL